MKSVFKNPAFLYSALIFLAALVWQASEISRGWNNNILGHQGFRQTQTAISAYYFLKDGVSLYTTIPVFGPPWILPYEFPLYQWILAGAAKLTGYPLDQTGRAISLLFHFISLALTFRILRFFRTSCEGSLFVLAMITLSPLGTYWAQGLLIESISVSLTLTYILFVLLALDSRSKTALTVGIIFGVLSAVVKVTSFAIGWGFLVLYALYWIYLNRNQSQSKFRSYHIPLFWITPLILPLVATAIWTFHTGAIIASLPFAGEGTSHLEWFFGMPWARWDGVQWINVFKHTVLFSLGTPLPLIFAIIPLCLSGTSRLKIGIFFCAALSGPLVFWNVYYVHDYYAYEILFFICITIGLCFEEGLKVSGKWMRLALGFLQILLLGSMVGGYYYTPYPWLLRTDHKADQLQFFDKVSEAVEEEEFILVAGWDWDPTVAYSTKRRTLVIRWNGYIYTDEFMEVYQNTLKSGYNCGGILIHGENVPAPMIKEMIDIFGMKKSPGLSMDESFFFFEKDG